MLERFGRHQDPGDRASGKTILKSLGDEFLFGVFAQTMCGGVLWFLLERAVNDRQSVLSVVLFQFSASEVQQIGNRLWQFQGRQISGCFDDRGGRLTGKLD